MTNFDAAMNKHQVAWRHDHVATQALGQHNGVERPWILPRDDWEQGLWPGIRSGSDNPLPKYLEENKVQKHLGVHNLKSSWVLCANLYFAFRRAPALLVKFLADRISDDIVGLERLELEYAEEPPLEPTTLLGEPKGKRGANQTSPDVAFIVSLRGGGRGLILTENKFTEHSFYECSGRQKKYGNPDPSRCLSAAKVLGDPGANCHQMNWQKATRTNRKYWDFVSVNEHGRKTLKRCPAAVSGYQLFRQQALAEGIACSGKYNLVVSCVAYDARNTTLISSLKNAGIDNFATDWGALFDGQARFAAFTHQDWVQWVRDNDAGGEWRKWLEWVEARYGF